jgi:hypothetical protein
LIVICCALMFKARCVPAPLGRIFAAGAHRQSPFIRDKLPVWARMSHASSIVLLKRIDYACLITLSAAALCDAVLLPQAETLRSTLPSARVTAYFATAHLAIGTKWIITQVPARVVVTPEVLRNVVCVVCALLYVHVLEPAGLTWAFVAVTVARGVFTALAVPAVVNACHNPLFKPEHLPGGMQICPALLLPALDALMCRLDALKMALAPEPLMGFRAVLGIHVSVAALTWQLDIRAPYPRITASSWPRWRPALGRGALC